MTSAHATEAPSSAPPSGATAAPATAGCATPTAEMDMPSVWLPRAESTDQSGPLPPGPPRAPESSAHLRDPDNEENDHAPAPSAAASASPTANDTPSTYGSPTASRALVTSLPAAGSTILACAGIAATAIVTAAGAVMLNRDSMGPP
ncbi:hypothetical protein [Salinactinospora qingdaonensis]|uniref:hypothetical protein n=1 Tax=Salinactinospora qingdaonensis TaxID=702744 RepID=UPI0031EBEC53